MFFKKIHGIYLVKALFNITDAMMFTINFLYLTNELHLSYALAVLLDLPVFISQFIVELPSGFFADRFGLKKSILIGAIALALSPLVYYFTTDYTLIFLQGILYGAGSAFISGAFESLAYQSFKADIKRYYTIRQLLQNSINVVIPVITIWFSQFWGFRIFYFFDFIFLSLIVFVLYFKVEDIQTLGEIQRNGLEFLRYGFSSVINQIKASKALYYHASATLLWGITSFAVDTFWIKVIELSSGVNSVGYVFALASIVGIVGNLLAWKLKLIKTTYWVSFLIHSFFVILTGIFIGKNIAILFLLGRSFFINLHEVLSNIIVNGIIKENRASMLSFFSFVAQIGKIVGSLCIGYLADQFGVGNIWIFAGLILLVISWQLYMVQKHAD